VGEQEEKQGPRSRQRTTLDVEAWRLSSGAPPARERNEVAVEASVVIDVQDVGTYSLVCTPTHTRALAVGFAFTEGIIQGLDDIFLLSDCEEDPGLVRMQLADSRNVRPPERNLTVPTSCGICGSRQAVEAFLNAAPQVGDSLRLSPEILRGVFGEMRARQQLFARTGGTHAAAIFNAEGAIMAFAEDERSGMTLCGFVRGDRATVYTHAHRIVPEPGTR